MKYFFSLLAFALLLFISEITAQSFPIDSATRKINYTDIVLADSVSSSQLYKNATEWVGKNFKPELNYDTQFNLVEGFVKCTAGQMVYTQGMMHKEIHGQITYDVKIDIKDHKYRYTFTNFVFEYYKQNREYKYVATGRKKPLEESKYPGWQGAWNKHRIGINNTILQHIASLKTNMLFVETNAASKPVIKKTDW